MLDTIVIDADVFMHSENPQALQQNDSKLLLSSLLVSTTKLCVDEGFELEESKNRSKIGCEYLTHVRHVSAAFAIIVKLGTSGRILKLSRTVDQNTGRVICRSVSDKSDRVYVRVAYNSASQVLASHDTTAYPTKAKGNIQQRIGVRVVDAATARQL
jgi:hypothetical protein